jgi:hypothetical protein
MSDFLRNLRSSNKSSPHSRKNLDGHYYPQTDRRILNDRRVSEYSENIEDLVQQIGLPMILEKTTALIQQVEKLTAANETLAKVKIQQTNAVTDFLNTLNKIISENSNPDISKDTPVKAFTSYTTGTHYTKDDILSIIQKMRKQGSTFSIIADYLKKKGIPTFSGRGEWHAQTIHRLCKPQTL